MPSVSQNVAGNKHNVTSGTLKPESEARANIRTIEFMVKLRTPGTSPTDDTPDPTPEQSPVDDAVEDSPLDEDDGMPKLGSMNVIDLMRQKQGQRT